MKTLIVYYSFTRNNELLAKTIQQRLNCDIYRIEEVTKRTGFKILLDLILDRTPRIKPHPNSVSAYEQCIFVAPIWAGRIASPLKTFLLQEKDHIKRYSFITVCSGAPQQKEKLAKSLTGLLGKEPGQVRELWINALLPEGKKDTIKYATGYRIQSNDLDKFERNIDEFVSGVDESYRLKQVVR